MNEEAIINQLRQNRTTFESMFAGVPIHQQMWKPDENNWSLLEVLCHLHDEEIEDFRARIRSVLSDPKQPLKPIDPGGWVTERAYVDQDYHTKLTAFLRERRESLQWLDSLKNPKWANDFQHSKLGAMSAGLFLANWLAHDYLHIRQINRLKYQYLSQQSGVDLQYAGNW